MRIGLHFYTDYFFSEETYTIFLKFIYNIHTIYIIELQKLHILYKYRRTSIIRTAVYDVSE